MVIFGDVFGFLTVFIYFILLFLVAYLGTTVFFLKCLDWWRQCVEESGQTSSTESQPQQEYLSSIPQRYHSIKITKFVILCIL